MEVERERLSHATSFAGTAQQLSLSMGVGTAALILHLTVGEAARAGLSSRDFIPAFLIVAAMSASAALVYARLPADAGAGLISRPTAERGDESRRSPPPLTAGEQARRKRTLVIDGPQGLLRGSPTRILDTGRNQPSDRARTVASCLERAVDGETCDGDFAGMVATAGCHHAFE